MPKTSLEFVSAIEAYRNRCEDRVAVFEAAERIVVVVADGAGGLGSGDIAAESVIREVQLAYRDIHSAGEWCAMLEGVDCRVSVGETTAVVVDIRPYGIAGASVGDSQAWVLHDGSIFRVTKNQSRKPLLGSHRAEPVSFTHTPLDGIMLVATDGLYDYAKRDAIKRMVFQSDFYALPRKCIEMVRLPTGELWDDIGVVAVRSRPRSRARQRYSI